MVNPLPLKSDQHLIFPVNIIPESNIKVKEWRKWSSTNEALDCLNKSFMSALKKCTGNGGESLCFDVRV